MDGVLNINKPSGMTSHDVVERVRRILHEKRIGHTGTLDPLATGVLVLCAGKATRIAQYLEAGEKEYKAVMRLGVTTDTLDAEGQVVATKSYTPPEKQRIIEVMKGFTGSIMQRPPAYSAVKVAGVPSYKLAREGRAELLKPRPVTIFSIELTAFEDPLVSLHGAVLKRSIHPHVVRRNRGCVGHGSASGRSRKNALRTFQHRSRCYP